MVVHFDEEIAASKAKLLIYCFVSMFQTSPTVRSRFMTRIQAVGESAEIVQASD